MKRVGLLLAIAVLALLFNSACIGASASAAEQQPAAAPQPGQSQPPPPPEYGPKIWGRGMMGPGMMGPGMMGPGMMGGGPMMMDFDPKTRGEMMEIQGRAMKEMGALIEKRGKELQQQK